MSHPDTPAHTTDTNSPPPYVGWFDHYSAGWQAVLVHHRDGKPVAIRLGDELPHERVVRICETIAAAGGIDLAGELDKKTFLPAVTTAAADVPDLLLGDHIDPLDPASVAYLTEITGRSIPDSSPAQTIVAVFRAARDEMNRRRGSHTPLYIEVGEDVHRLMTQDTADAREAQRLCADVYQHGWMVGVMPIDMTAPPHEADHECPF
ncbi:hypothetical protein [Nonomuraea longicatena]|uniref:Uncharacterized protein n=1 Tax=Nonomuraea longicatena TaxID=83682 RepID=A0ABN1QYL2_9ACTN